MDKPGTVTYVLAFLNSSFPIIMPSVEDILTQDPHFLFTPNSLLVAYGNISVQEAGIEYDTSVPSLPDSR